MKKYSIIVVLTTLFLQNYSMQETFKEKYPHALRNLEAIAKTREVRGPGRSCQDLSDEFGTLLAAFNDPYLNQCNSSTYSISEPAMNFLKRRGGCGRWSNVDKAAKSNDADLKVWYNPEKEYFTHRGKFQYAFDLEEYGDMSPLIQALFQCANSAYHAPTSNTMVVKDQEGLRRLARECARFSLNVFGEDSEADENESESYFSLRRTFNPYLQSLRQHIGTGIRTCGLFSLLGASYYLGKKSR